MKSIHGLSEQLLLQVKLQEETIGLEENIASFSFEELVRQLQTDEEKKSFWINIYNSYFILLRRQGLTKPKVYTKKAVQIAGILFSLDEIEHGILRRFKFKYSLGFLRSFFVPLYIRTLAVDRLDYRIHFALNCGAKSCPPIAFYTPLRIDDLLELATLSFLESETFDHPERQEVQISTLFKWYWADFGGRRGIQEILWTKLGQSTEGKKLVFTPYNWDEDLDNFASFEG